MKATDWEFRNRAMIFGLIFACSFPLYAVDPQNVASAVAEPLAIRFAWDADLLTRLLFWCAALLLTVAAFIRTWASAYLQAGVVYAGNIKTESLVADGPYRFVRNPLYLANVLMAVSLGALMSRTGFVVAVVAMLVFCYRLILREEAEFQTNQGGAYERYRELVPRLWPSARPRIPASARRAKWSAGFRAEFWYWGFALAITAFAITLKTTLFFIILGASIGLFWLSLWLLQRKSALER